MNGFSRRTNDEGIREAPPVGEWMDRFDLTRTERFILFVLTRTAAKHGDDPAVDSFVGVDTIAAVVATTEDSVRKALARLVAIGALCPVTSHLHVLDAEIVHEGFELVGFDARWT